MSVEQLKDLKRVASEHGELIMLDKIESIINMIDTRNSIELEFKNKVLNELKQLSNGKRK